jgi:hypothetical protein
LEIIDAGNYGDGHYQHHLSPKLNPEIDDGMEMFLQIPAAAEAGETLYVITDKIARTSYCEINQYTFHADNTIGYISLCFITKSCWRFVWWTITPPRSDPEAR